MKTFLKVYFAQDKLRFLPKKNTDLQSKNLLYKENAGMALFLEYCDDTSVDIKIFNNI